MNLKNKLIKIRLTERQKNQIYSHLYPGDGLEAACLAICGRAGTAEEEIMIFQEIILIPYEKCTRTEVNVTWSTDIVEPYMDKIDKEDLALIKLHSHPNGYNRFSQFDDESDVDFLGSIFSYTDGIRPHASLVMLPNGKFISRAITPNLKFEKVDSIMIVGDSIDFQFHDSHNTIDEAINLRNIQTLGSGTTKLLSELKIGVVGCSGTGSLIIEFLNRLNTGCLVIADPKKMELRNLNRIVNSRLKHATDAVYKVEIFENAGNENGFDTKFIAIPDKIEAVGTIKHLSRCDLIFGCVDTALGRHYINQISTYYTIPIFDIGVGIEQVNGTTAINTIDCAVNYVQPGESFIKRRIFSALELADEELQFSNPALYEQKVRDGYISNVDSPAVISINASISSLGTNEFLSRIHDLKPYENSLYNKLSLSLTEFELDRDFIDGFTEKMTNKIGLGDRPTLIGLIS